MLYCPLGMVCGIGAARHGASANLVRHEGRRARCEGRGALGSAGLCRNARSFHLAREGARGGHQTVRTAHGTGRFLEHAVALGDWVLVRGHLRAAGARHLLLMRALVVLEHAVHFGERRSLAVVIAQARAAVRLTQMMARASRAPA